MERYELAKKQGLNWQVVLIQDCETDIKRLTLDCVINGLDYGSTNKKVMELINKTVNELESEELKKLTKETLTNYASRIYLEWVKVFGTAKLGVALLGIFGQKGIKAPESLVKTLNALPDKLPEYVYNRAVPKGIEPKTYEKEVIDRINQISDSVAKPDYSERYSLRASAERQVRYEAQQKQLNDLKESGVRLVWIDEHANCSERCQDWQGKLYSTDGTSGTIDGIRYQPLSNATDRYTTTKAGKTYINGTLTGFGCRHKTILYKKGFRPTKIPAEVIDKQRAIEQRQREMERAVRKYEARALDFKTLRDNPNMKASRRLNDAGYKHNKALVEKWRDEYLKFCEENHVPSYYSRLRV